MGRRVRCPFLSARVHSSTTSQHSFCFPENCIYGRYRYQKMMKIALLLCLVGVALGNECKESVSETIKLSGSVPTFARSLGIDKSSFAKTKNVYTLKIACCCKWADNTIQQHSLEGSQEQLFHQKCVRNTNTVKFLGANNKVLLATVKQGEKDTVGYQNVITIKTPNCNWSIVKKFFKKLKKFKKIQTLHQNSFRKLLRAPLKKLLRRKLLQSGNGNC